MLENVYIQADLYETNQRYDLYHTPRYSARFDSNFLAYRCMPTGAEFEKDCAHLKTLQASYPINFLKFRFPENVELGSCIETALQAAGFEVSELVLMTVKPSSIQLRNVSSKVIIQKVDQSNFVQFFEYERANLAPYGSIYVEQMKEYYHELFSNPTRHILLATLSDGTIVGTACVYESANFVELDHFNVMPACQRQGIGSALQQATVKLAGERTLLLCAEVSSHAFYMYQKQGYRVQSRFFEATKYQVEPNE